MLRPLPESMIAEMNKEFADVLMVGGFENSPALPEERGEPNLADLPRLVFQPHKRNFARIRKVIDTINEA
jgi:hypothetical protein